jgi:hypothetical protein
MDIYKNNTESYINKIYKIALIHVLISVLITFLSYFLLANEVIFCFVIGMTLSSVISYINMYCIAGLVYQSLCSSSKKSFLLLKVIASFALFVLIILFITFNYRKIVLGLSVGLILPSVVISANYILYKYNK